MPSAPIYSLRTQDVYKALETAPEGLSSAEAQSRQSLYGENRLSEQHKIPIWEKLLMHFMHPQAGILLVASILALIGGDFVLALVTLT
ncbi:MAG: hypothetical protein EHM81_09685, partial [Chloroflexi bacterium]